MTFTVSQRADHAQRKQEERRRFGRTVGTGDVKEPDDPWANDTATERSSATALTTPKGVLGLTWNCKSPQPPATLHVKNSLQISRKYHKDRKTLRCDTG